MKYIKSPDRLTVGEKEYPIDVDFRTWGTLSSDIANCKTDKESFDVLLKFILNQGLLLSKDSFLAALSFFACEKQEKKADESAESKSEKRIKDRPFDFIKDEPLIYAAFLGQYGIDLRSASLHWWDFCALLQGLSEEQTICKIMSYRTLDLSKVDKKQRSHYKQIKDKYALDKPKHQTLEQRNNALRERIIAIQKEVGKNGRT